MSPQAAGYHIFEVLKVNEEPGAFTEYKIRPRIPVPESSAARKGDWKLHPVCLALSTEASLINGGVAGKARAREGGKHPPPLSASAPQLEIWVGFYLYF